jgi:hypothetical protein
MARRRDDDDDFVLPLGGTLDTRKMLLCLQSSIDSPGALAELLGRALVALDDAGRARLLADYKSDRKVSRGLTAAFAANEPPGDNLADQWKHAWKRWESVIRLTNQDDNPYLQNTISYNNADLNMDAILSDLDDAASMMLPLVKPVVEQEIVPRFDLVVKATRLLDTICSTMEWVIRPDDIVTLGAPTSQLFLEWIDAVGEARKEPREKRVDRAEKLHEDKLPEVGFELHTKTFDDYIKGRPVKTRKKTSK